MHFNGLKLSSASKEFSITSQFLVSKCKIQTFEENKGFECIFFRIEVQVISNPSSRLEKTHQTPEFLLMNDLFMIFLKKSSISTFLIFSKIINCTY